jgi:hypothetical protein
MTDLLPPRLLARVERSLRKRIHTDIHPHLVRCAAHAHSEEAFMASAARLLADPREREQWLASWQRRAPAAPALADGPPPSADPAPAPPLDTTSLAALDAPVQRSFQLPASQVGAIREALVRELGPMGGLLVDSESRQSASAEELLSRLQRHLPDAHRRARFVVNSSLSSVEPGA